MVANTTPRLKLVNNKVSIDHPNRVVGELLMMEALGTGDRDFMHGILVQLTEAAGSQGRPPNETDLNFMLSVIKDRKPRDHFECMLATQAAAVHMVAMRFANYLMNSDNLSQQDSAERVFSKATRTFPVQMKGPLCPRQILGSFRNRLWRQSLPLLFRRLSKAHTRSATVLVDELDPRSFQGQLHFLDGFFRNDSAFSLKINDCR
jgi:hypothetical protein